MLDHAGYCNPPGRAVCALELARAENLLDRAERLGIAETEWVDDYDLDLSWDEDGSVADGLEAGRLAAGGCVVRCGDRQESLWGIVVEAPTWRGDDPYVRIVRAELASEMIDDLRQAIGDTADARDEIGV
jgi:hypothetical protein